MSNLNFKVLSTFAVLCTLAAPAFAVLGAQESLSKLMEGNKRFAEGKTERPHSSIARRLEVAKGQKPFAVVVTCSDSRLSPELIFDQGLGDLFVVRVAGNTIDPVGLGSIEYAVSNLGAKAVVVMGHERCGAVEAAIKGGVLPGSLPSVVEPIHAAVKLSAGDTGANRLEKTVSLNVLEMVKVLKNSSIVGKMIREKQIDVAGLHYDLETGIAKRI